MFSIYTKEVIKEKKKKECEEEGRKSFWGPGERKCILIFEAPLSFEITFYCMDCFIILQRECKIISVTLDIHGSLRHAWR